MSTTATTRTAPRSRVRALATRIDWVLVLAVGAITAFGLRMVAVTTKNDIAADPGFFATRQLIYVVVGLGLMAAAMAIDLDIFARRPLALWGALIASVAVVLAIGTTARGSTRWIDLGFFQIQPSEIGKIVIAMVIAGVVVDRHAHIAEIPTILYLLGIGALPTFIIFVQPDLGTSLVHAAIIIGILFLAGVPGRYFAWAGGGLAVLVSLVVWVLPAVGVHVLQDYQMARLTSFVDSSADPNDAGFQSNQARTAVGHGGATGTGVDGATQVNNDLLPEHHTDFIFASTAEMFGFVGVSLLICVFGLLIWRCLRITLEAPTLFEQLVAGGLTTMFAFQAFVNIGMNIGIMPITGIPLPFMSFGGAHTLTSLIAVGILLRIHRRSTSRSI